jgi:hypothetical protein
VTRMRESSAVLRTAKFFGREKIAMQATEASV